MSKLNLKTFSKIIQYNEKNKMYLGQNINKSLVTVDPNNKKYKKYIDLYNIMSDANNFLNKYVTNKINNSCIIYIRCSTKIQKSSYKNQLQKLIKYAQVNNMNIDNIYIDLRSGRNMIHKKFEFGKCLKELKQNLLITDIDRLGRNAKGVLKIIHEFINKNIKLHIVNTSPIIIETIDDITPELIMEIKISEKTSDMISRKVKLYHSIKTANNRLNHLVIK